MPENKTKTLEEVIAENEELRARLDEAEDVIRAIQSGEVDAVVVSGPEGEKIYTLSGAERTYRILVEAMNEGALVLSPEGVLIYCNGTFASMLGSPVYDVLGHSIYEYVAEADVEHLRQMLEQAPDRSSRREVNLKHSDSGSLPAFVSISNLETEAGPSVSAVVTDLSDHKRTETQLRQYREHLEEMVIERTKELVQSNEKLQSMAEQLREEVEQRAKIEDELRESEARATSILNAVTESIWSFDTEGRIVTGNAAAFECWNMTPNEMIGKIANDYVPPDLAASRKAIFDAVIRDGVPARWEDKRTGVVFDHSAYPVRNSEGEVTGITVFSRDITERKQAEEALRQKEADLTEAQRLAHLGSWYWDAETDVTTGTDELYLIFGLNPARQPIPAFKEQEGRLYPAEDWQRINVAIQETMRTGIGYDLDVKAIRNGRPIWVTTRSEVVRDSDGRITGLRGTVQDITERKQAEEDLRQSERRYSALFANKINGMAHCRVITDKDGRPVDYRILEINEAYERIISVNKADVEGRLVTDVFPDIKNYEIDYIGMYGKVALESGEIRFEEFFEASQQYLSIYAYSPIQGEFIAIFTDVTDRKQAEEDLRQSEARVKAIAQAGGIGFFEWNASTDTAYWSPEHYALFGYEPDSPISWQRWLQGVHPEDRERVEDNAAQLLERCRAGGQVQGHKDEYRFIRPDGSVVWLESDLSLSIVGDEVIARGSVRDITERKQAEEALRESERRLIGVLESMPDAFVSFDSDMRYTYVNNNAERLQSARREDLLGRYIRDVYSDEESLKTIREYERVMQEQKSVILTSYHAGFDGWVELRAFPTPDGVSVFYKDVSAQVKAEEGLRESRDRFEVLTRNLHSGVALVDELGRFSIVNPAFLRMFDLSEDSDIANVNDRDWGVWRVYDEFEVLLDVDEHPVRKAAMTGKAVRNKLVGVLSPAGETLRWMLVSADPIIKPDGRINAMICTYYDITERKQAEDILRESREDMARAQEVGQIGSWRLDVRRNILTWSTENHRIFGIPEGTALTYETFLESIHPDDREYVDTQWNAGMRGEPYNVEHRIVVEGQVKWVREKAYLELDSEGNLLGGFGITQDITELKQTEEALTQARSEAERRTAELESFVYSQVDGVSMFDSEGRILWMNDAGREILRVPPEEDFSDWVSRYEVFNLDGTPLLPEQRMAYRALGGERISDFRYRMVTPNGENIVLSVSASPVFDGQGCVIGLTSTF